ncbi:hypothetical protein [Phyllobacterium sp. SB3]|uniref:hypothetical protein n=1 Tax=Phyllobacterium sp. SB3 TaxID=3156073 RepID=UPI0032AF06A5
MPNKLKHAYGFWFDQLLTDFICQHKCETESEEEYASRNGFFITLNFDTNAVASRKRSLHDQNETARSIELWNTNHLYNLLCNKLIGRNFLKAKNHNRLPKMIACVDVNGTRHWHSMGEVQNIHIHTIWMLPSDLTEKFKTALNEIDLSRFDFRQIDVQPITSLKNNRSGPSTLSSYTGKFLGFNNHNLEVSEDIMIYPRAR